MTERLTDEQFAEIARAIPYSYVLWPCDTYKVLTSEGITE